MLLYTQYKRRLGSQYRHEVLLERINLKSRYNRYTELAKARKRFVQLGSE